MAALSLEVLELERLPVSGAGIRIPRASVIVFASDAITRVIKRVIAIQTSDTYIVIYTLGGSLTGSDDVIVIPVVDEEQTSRLHAAFEVCEGLPATIRDLLRISS